MTWTGCGVWREHVDSWHRCMLWGCTGGIRGGCAVCYGRV